MWAPKPAGAIFITPHFLWLWSSKSERAVRTSFPGLAALMCESLVSTRGESGLLTNICSQGAFGSWLFFRWKTVKTDFGNT